MAKDYEDCLVEGNWERKTEKCVSFDAKNRVFIPWNAGRYKV